MKKIKVLMLALMAFVTVIWCKPQLFHEVEAAYEESMLDPSVPAGYYDGVDLSKSPDDIKKDLYYIISNGYVKHSYSANNEVLKKTDPDPNNSNNIICFYTGLSLPSGSWNKEHVWAKSHGFPESGYSSSEPYSDAHHLRPTQNSINSSRGNKDFGEVTSGGSSDAYGNKWTNTIFEPRDEVKGDVARIMFYMETRYGSETQFNLQLVDEAPTSGSTLNGKFGNLQTLIKWHYEDPVSQEEIYRNNVIYTYYQKNRNPYIDHPEYVDYIYPSEYSDVEADQTKVDNVIALINALPSLDDITLDDEAKINEASDAYYALNYKERELVTNYTDLTKAVEKLDSLKNPSGGSDDPSSPVGDSETVDFTTVTNSLNYQANVNISVDNKDFFLSHAGNYSGELRLGTNASTASVDSKFTSITDKKASSLEMMYDVENATGVSFTYTNQYSVTNWYIYFSSDGGKTYKLVNSGSASDAKFEAALDEATTGRFALVIGNSESKAPRLGLGQMSLFTGEPEDLFEVGLTSSISIMHNDTEVLAANLRFGLTVTAPLENANYSLYYYTNEDGTKLSSLYNEGMTVEEFDALAEEMGATKVNITDPTKMFIMSVDKMTDFKKTTSVVVVYELDGKLYFSTQHNVSFMDEFNNLIQKGNITLSQSELFKSYFK